MHELIHDSLDELARALSVLTSREKLGNAYQRIATRAAVEGWPTPIVFSGFEIGAAITTGLSLEAAPAENPVRTAYSIYTNGTFRRTHSYMTPLVT